MTTQPSYQSSASCQCHCGHLYNSQLSSPISPHDIPKPTTNTSDPPISFWRGWIASWKYVSKTQIWTQAWGSCGGALGLVFIGHGKWWSILVGCLFGLFCGSILLCLGVGVRGAWRGETRMVASEKKRNRGKHTEKG
ncbi:hypothetical protein B0J14DRAFT_316511 [Halenospora varia]|nr:hypothetical protein B0J14DRAFT_316511 [Halenospora varia]